MQEQGLGVRGRVGSRSYRFRGVWYAAFACLLSLGCYSSSVVGKSGLPDASDDPPRGSDAAVADAAAPIPSTPRVPSRFVAGHGEYLNLGTVLGDLDGDGLDDFVLGISSSETGGTAYLFYGRPEFAEQIDTSAADAMLADPSLTMQGIGDVNADGLDDFMFEESAGTRVVFGRRQRLRSQADVASDSVVWSPGAPPSPYAPGSHTIRAMPTGDLNGDGATDLIVVLPAWADDSNVVLPGQETPAPRTFVVLGHGGPWAGGLFDPAWASAELREGADPGSGYISAMPAGDIDGDGCTDLINTNAPGLLYGGRDRWHGVVDVSSTDVAFVGAGWGIQGAGDIDGDGLGDLVVMGESDLGIVYGRRERWTGSISLTVDWTLRFELYPAQLVAVGDLNGDAAPDLIFRGYSDMEAPHGVLYVVNGSGQRTHATRSVTRADEFANGSALEPSATDGPPGPALSFGSSVGVGDVDGDGSDDLLIAAPAGDVVQLESGGAVLLIPSTPKRPD